MRILRVYIFENYFDIFSIYARPGSPESTIQNVCDNTCIWNRKLKLSSKTSQVYLFKHKQLA